VSWKPEVEGIEERRRRAQELGGAEAVARQHELGRLTIRERIEALADGGSLREQGPIAGHAELGPGGALRSFTPANYVLGLAKIDGRPCVVGGEDFTLRGGSPSPAGLRKSIFAEDLALGAVAGFPAARLVASHLAVMTRHTAQVMVAGPAVVERAMRETTSKEELGGAAVHERNGVVDLVVEDEREVFGVMRRFLSYLPTNVHELPPRAPCDDPRQRVEEELLSIVPRDRRKVYEMRRIVEAVVDRGSFFELAPRYGRSQITGLARLDGHPLGVLANDPRFYAGAMTAHGARKVRRFVDLCEAFHLPVLSLVDEPGFMLGSAAEKAATIRYGAEALFAVVQSSVPWASVIVRKTYGVAAAAHFGPGGYVLAWPSAEGGALPIEGGVAVAFRRDIAAAPDPEARRRELEEQLAAGRSAFPRGESFGVHDLIDPRRTRPALCDWLDWIQPLLRNQLGPRTHPIRP
jgi:acetyl-CoA carboxylase carboxyltransferase component